MAVLETVRKAMAEGDVDFLREGVRVLAQAVMEAEVSELTGVPHGERNPERRLTNRNGYRERRWDTEGRHDRPGDPQGPRWLLLPEPARATPASGAGPPALRGPRQHRHLR
jgi:Transposase, Mutator family